MKFYQTTMTKYFFYLLLLNPINCFTMENVNTLQTEDDRISIQVSTIRDMLDEQLGVSKYSYCRPLIGSIMSYYATSFLSQQQIYEKINGIERCIKICPATKNSPAHIQQQIFERLLRNHLYVRYSVNAYRDQVIKKFENITCSTLDQLLNPDFSADTIGIKKHIHDRAREIFIQESEINNPIKSVWQLTDALYCDNPHYTILKTTHDIKFDSLKTSTNKKYLQIKDVNNNLIIWDTDHGTQIIQIPHNIEWSPSPKAEKDHALISNDTFFAITLEKTNAIIFAKLPTLESYLCQKLFKKNQSNLEQLKILNTSKTLNAIEGFCGKNMKQQVNNAINTLALHHAIQ